MAPRPPAGWRSPVLGVRGAGFLRPLAAVLAGLILPAIVAWVLLLVAQEPGMLDSTGLRRAILFVLYALFAAPLPGFFLLPILWALALGLAALGRAGLLSVLTATLAVGLAAVHLVLNADLTTESPGAIPGIVVALVLQGTVAWAVLGWRRTPARTEDAEQNPTG